MSDARSTAVVMTMLRAIEERELDRLPELYDPDLTLHWPPGLPYGGRHAGTAALAAAEAFRAVWDPLQPTPALRRMNPQVVGTGPEGRVAVRYLWRGEAPGAGRHEAETLAEYVLRDGRLARAQMFHFDLLGLLAFLRRAGVGGVAAPAT